MAKKKLLLIHNKYRDFGGEDVAVKNEIRLLEKYFNVEVLNFDNSIKNYIQQFVAFAINKNVESGRVVSSIINNFKPDIIYVHNSWFKASVEIFNVILKSNAKIIIKLHNFRYKCTNSYSLKKHLNESIYCEACALNGSKYKIFNKYFTSSYVKSILVIRYGKKYYEILKNTKVNILVLTSFHKSYLERNGFRNISVYPNYLDLVNLEEKNKHIKENYILYAGRISQEKGVDELIDSFMSSDLVDFSLKIVGEGPTLETLKIKYNNPRVDFINFVENSRVLNLIENSKAIVTATKLWEGQPTLLCEASLLGVPSIFPKNGGIAEFFPDNYKLSFEKNNYIDLKNKLNVLLDDTYIKEIGRNNKKFIKSKLDEKNLIKKFNNIINE
jgi:glycosyltransferase involved in cell wall biosynthesis